jgi:hypothetical protein
MLEATNAREGIKTSTRLGVESGKAGARGLEATNAREGIKTHLPVRPVRRRELGLEATNAREGIKTHNGYTPHGCTG